MSKVLWSSEFHIHLTKNVLQQVLMVSIMVRRQWFRSPACSQPLFQLCKVFTIPIPHPHFIFKFYRHAYHPKCATSSQQITSVAAIKRLPQSVVLPTKRNREGSARRTIISHSNILYARSAVVLLSTNIQKLRRCRQQPQSQQTTRSHGEGR